MEQKNTRGGKGRGQGRKSPYGETGAKIRSFSLPAGENYHKAIHDINEVLKKYHIKLK